MTKLGPQAMLAGGNSIFGNGGSYKTTDDLQFKANLSMSMRENVTNFTSNISQEEPSKLINMLSKCSTLTHHVCRSFSDSGRNYCGLALAALNQDWQRHGLAVPLQGRLELFLRQLCNRPEDAKDHD